MVVDDHDIAITSLYGSGISDIVINSVISEHYALSPCLSFISTQHCTNSKWTVTVPVDQADTTIGQMDHGRRIPSGPGIRYRCRYKPPVLPIVVTSHQINPVPGS